MKKVISILLALTMILSLMTIDVLASDDYPSKYKSAARDAVVDEWNFYNRECTSFVAWCLNSRNGVAFTNWYGGVRWGNANNWGNAAKSIGIAVDSTPAVGAVAWSNSGQYGHVAWVSAVNGNNVTIEEYNYNYNGNYNTRTVAKSSFSGYIHIKDTPQSVSVSFTPWDYGANTYVRETDASFGQEINVTGGTATDTGMYLYDANGNFLAKGANGCYYHRVYFKINEELGYTLTKGTTYKYKFYAIVNGQTYWSKEYSFKTDGPTPTAVSTDVSSACGIEEGTYTLTPACATGSRLDIAGASTDSGANVQLYSANDTIAQEFTIESVGKPYYRIVAKCSEMVLDVQGALTDSGTNVMQYPHHGGTNQKWIFVDAGGGYYYIRPANNTNLSLDVWNGDSADGTNIWVYNNNQTNAQKWKLNKVVTVAEKSAPTNVSVTTDKKEYLQGQSVKITPSATGMNFYTIRIEDGNGTVVFSDYSGTLKESLNYTPTKAGEYKVYISACNDWEHYTDANCSFTVKRSGNDKEEASDETGNNQSAEEIKPIEQIEEEKPDIEDKAYSFRFPRTNVYHQDQFDDVKANQWFTQTVADAFEMGLVKGMSATEFSPYGDVTVAEAVTMAARIHKIYTSGTEDFSSNGGMWYQVYLDYAYENGVISRAYYNSDVSQKATRAQFAEIFASAMDDKGLYPISTVADNAIPDVKMTATYANDVYKLYRAGILAGNDTLGTFSPNTYITRAEASAILARMADTNNRLSFSIK